MGASMKLMILLLCLTAAHLYAAEDETVRPYLPAIMLSAEVTTHACAERFPDLAASLDKAFAASKLNTANLDDKAWLEAEKENHQFSQMQSDARAHFTPETLKHVEFTQAKCQNWLASLTDPAASTSNAAAVASMSALQEFRPDNPPELDDDGNEVAH